MCKYFIFILFCSYHVFQFFLDWKSVPKNNREKHFLGDNLTFSFIYLLYHKQFLVFDLIFVYRGEMVKSGRGMQGKTVLCNQNYVSKILQETIFANTSGKTDNKFQTNFYLLW